MGNDALGHCPKDLQQLVGAAIRPIFRVGSLQEARRLLAAVHQSAGAGQP
jgi:hypothetical protein